MDITKTLISKIKPLQEELINHKLSSQDVINKIQDLKPLFLKHHVNLDNYLYQEGLFNQKSALVLLKKQINKYKKFPDKTKPYQKEYKAVKNSKQKWFENYGIHDGSHNLIKTTIDNWKVNSVLTCIVDDLYVGSATENYQVNLMK